MVSQYIHSVMKYTFKQPKDQMNQIPNDNRQNSSTNYFYTCQFRLYTWPNLFNNARRFWNFNGARRLTSKALSITVPTNVHMWWVWSRICFLLPTTSCKMADNISKYKWEMHSENIFISQYRIYDWTGPLQGNDWRCCRCRIMHHVKSEWINLMIISASTPVRKHASRIEFTCSSKYNSLQGDLKKKRLGIRNRIAIFYQTATKYTWRQN